MIQEDEPKDVRTPVKNLNKHGRVVLSLLLKNWVIHLFYLFILFIYYTKMQVFVHCMNTVIFFWLKDFFFSQLRKYY